MERSKRYRFSGNSGENDNEKRGIPLKVFVPFRKKIPVERAVSFDSPPKQPGFLYKWKAPPDKKNFNAFLCKPVVFEFIRVTECERGQLSMSYLV